MRKEKNTKLEEVKEEVKVEKTDTKKKRKYRNIIIIIVAIVLLYCFLPSITIFTALFFGIDNTKFIENNNSIIVDNGKVTISNINEYYYNETKEYIVYGYISNVKKDYTIDIEYNLYDSNNYVIGTAFCNLEMKKGENYKFKAIYYDNDASEVVNYKLKDINLY